jgi:hypothetical protein
MGRWSISQIGPNAQEVVDSQMPEKYDIYVGSMKHRFGTPTGKHGSGTESEFHDALERWGKVGRPWTLFHFNEEETNPYPIDYSQFSKVQECRRKLETLGL